ncbi:hypothetical protein IWW54_002891, partial [Coemansia sp. RSA 2705]
RQQLHQPVAGQRVGQPGPDHQRPGQQHWRHPHGLRRRPAQTRCRVQQLPALGGVGPPGRRAGLCPGHRLPRLPAPRLRRARRPRQPQRPGRFHCPEPGL